MNSNKEDTIKLDFAVPGPIENGIPCDIHLSKLPNVLHLHPHTVYPVLRECVLVRVHAYGDRD